MKQNYQILFIKPIIPLILSLFFLPIASVSAAKPPEKPGWHYLNKDKVVNKGAELTLIPTMSFEAEIREKLEKNTQGVNIELLYTMPLPDVKSYSSREELLLMLYNSLAKVSDLSGLMYYSGTKEEMALYLEECYIVNKEGSRKAIPDTSYTSLPDKSSFIIYQKDVHFDKNWYRAEIVSAPDAIWMELTNLNKITYGLAPVLAPETFNIDMVLIPGDDHIKIYIMCQMEKKEVKILFKTVKLDGFFNHRVSAYQGWIARQLYREPRPGKLKD